MTVVRHAWRAPSVDARMADALAVVTLYASPRPGDPERAEALLDELTARSTEDVIGGLVSVAASLLVLLEFEATMPAPEALARLGELIAYNEVATRPGCG
ncbi:MAG TPA: hypothetical protein VFA96_08095 [Nocardioides sp.]|nr:hypothetical protein [Nocardioides sp.]